MSHTAQHEGGRALFSFTMVCETLGIEPDYLRLGLRRWRKMQPHGELRQRVARRSPVIRNGSIVSENSARERPASVAPPQAGAARLIKLKIGHANLAVSGCSPALRSSVPIS